MSADLLLTGGEDHHLRIPFMKQLREKGFNVAALGSCDGGPFERAGFAFHHFKFARFIDPLADWAAIGELRWLFAALRPRIVQSFDTKPNFLVPIAARPFADLAVIRTINGMGWLYSSRSAKALTLRPVYRALYQLASRSAAMTVFQNREDLEYFGAHGMIGSGSSRLIPGSGVDLEAFQKLQSGGASAELLREQLRLGSAEVVLTVTRLTRQKGIPTLLKAAALVQEKRPGVRFILVGPRESEGPQAVSQEELDRHAPYVTGVGSRSDVPSLLSIANVFAFPTEYREGVPRVLLEASLAGLPIVTTRMPGCNDVITDGVSGYLVSPRSPRELAARILDLLEHPEEGRVMGQQAREVVRRHFGLPTIVEQYCESYREFLGSWRGREHAGRVSGESEARVVAAP